MKQVQNTDEIFRLGATEIARLVKKRVISCREAVAAHLDRIGQVNEHVNAIVKVLSEQALEQADGLDSRIARGESTGPLAGVPITVKENIDLAGSPTTFGIPAMQAAYPERDAPHIAQLKQAGAVPIGRTNLSEMGLRPHTDNPLHGETKNPWKTKRTPGGSSGGDAVAVATGMTPLGLGNDYGGSLRGPAQFNGVCSIKPSLGRVPDHMSLMPSEPGISSQLFLFQGPIARHVKDLRLALEQMSGFDVRDPRWVPAPIDGEMAHASLRIAVVTDPGGLGVAPKIAKGVHKAADWLSDAGYAVDRIDPPQISDAWWKWVELTCMETQTLVLPGAKEISTAETLAFLQNWADLSSNCSLTAYMEVLAQRNAIARKWAEFQETYPLILGPALTEIDFEPGFDIRSADEVQRFILASRLMMAANFLGLPAAVLPVENPDDGAAVQIIGSRFGDGRVLDAAEVLEQYAGVFTPIDPPN
jgi:amidase